jgi:REP element-mobilizing transposase RayT
MMKFNPDIHHRRSIRLKEYDYSQAGAYFVTLCTHERECLFGEIVDGEMRMNQFGRIIAAEWIRLAELREEIELGESVVMPNHIHGVLIFKENIASNAVGAIHELPLPMRQQRRKMALPKIIGRFKMITAKRINVLRDTPGVPVWQRNYHEHIIRDDSDYNRIAEYIATNPQRWIEDKLHPDNFIVGENFVKRANVGDSGNIGGDADIVGAIHELPQRNVPQPGGRNE